jgi:hypothetical protein
LAVYINIILHNNYNKKEWNGMEKKAWENPEIMELKVEETEYGGDNSKNVDGPYLEVGTQKYWPSGS